MLVCELPRVGDVSLLIIRDLYLLFNTFGHTSFFPGRILVFYLCGSIAMQIDRKPYEFTDADRLRIEALGYRISGIPAGHTLESIMPTLFPNFDLAGLLEIVDRLFAPTTALPIRRLVHYNIPKQILHFIFENTSSILDETVAFDRVISWIGKEIIVEHRYCLVPVPHQGKGLIKPVFQESLQQYVNMGVCKIVVHAGFAGGGYTWARHGFVAVNRDEVEFILLEARNRLTPNELSAVERIFSKYYHDRPTGRGFPMILWANLPGMKDILRGADWRGELDLRNPEQFSNFTNYVWRS